MTVSRFQWVLVGALMVVFSSAVALAEDKKASPSPTASPKPKDDANSKKAEQKWAFTGDFADIVKECKPNEAQQDAIHKIQLEQEKTLTEFDKSRKAAKDDLDKKIAAAKNEKDKASLQAKIAAIDADRERVAMEFRKKAFDKLSPEQRIKYIEVKLESRLGERFKGLGMTEEQTTKWKSTLAADAKKIQQPIMLWDPKVTAEVESHLVSILTEPQRNKYNEAKLKEATKK